MRQGRDIWCACMIEQLASYMALVHTQKPPLVCRGALLFTCMRTHYAHTHTVLPGNCIMMMLLWSPNKIIHASFFFMHLSFSVFLRWRKKSAFVRRPLVLLPLTHLHFVMVFLEIFVPRENNVEVAVQNVEIFTRTCE